MQDSETFVHEPPGMNTFVYGGSPYLPLLLEICSWAHIWINRDSVMSADRLDMVGYRSSYFVYKARMWLTCAREWFHFSAVFTKWWSRLLRNLRIPSRLSEKMGNSRNYWRIYHKTRKYIVAPASSRLGPRPIWFIFNNSPHMPNVIVGKSTVICEYR